MTNSEWQQLGRDLAKLALDSVSDGVGYWDEDERSFAYDDNDERRLGRDIAELLQKRLPS